METSVEEEVDIYSSIRGGRFSCTGARVYDEKNVES